MASTYHQTTAHAVSLIEPGPDNRRCRPAAKSGARPDMASTGGRVRSSASFNRANSLLHGKAVRSCRTWPNRRLIDRWANSLLYKSEMIGFYARSYGQDVRPSQPRGRRPHRGAGCPTEAIVEQAFPMGIIEPAMIGTTERHSALPSLCLDLLLAELRLTRP